MERLVVKVGCVPTPEVSVAVIVAFTVEFEGTVFTGKLAEVAPAGTVTLGAQTAFGELLERGTTIPFPIAGSSRVTVPTALFPPTTVEGFKETPEITGTARIVSGARPSRLVIVDERLPNR
jgi:hypothetical protein